MNTQLLERTQTKADTREEARAQRILLRHRNLRSALTYIAHREGFDLTDELISAAVKILSTQENMPTAAETVHQLKRALFQAESVVSY